MKLIITLMFLVQPQDNIPRIPIRDWQITIEQMTVNGRREIVARISGKEARPISDTFFEIIEPRVLYYTEPSERDPQSRKVRFRARKGTFDMQKGVLKIIGAARVETEDGIVMELEDLTIRVEKTRHKRQRFMFTDRPFTLRRPGIVLTGVGLEADEALLRVVAKKNAVMTLRGDPKAVMQGILPSETDPMVSRVSCAGPLVIQEFPSPKEAKTRHFHADAYNKVVFVQRIVGKIPEEPDGGARRKKHLLRLSKDGEIRIRCDRARICMSQVAETKEKKQAMQMEGAVAWGHLVATQGKTLRAEADRAVWYAASQRLELDAENGIPTKFEDMNVRSGRVVVDNLTREIKFLDGVDIAGLVAKDRPPLKASGKSFIWSRVEGQGILTGDPLVRMEQEGALIETTRVAVVGQDLIILQGYKRIRMVQEGRTFAVTCDGDATIDRTSNIITLSDNCRVVVKGEFRMFCERIRVRNAGKKDAVLEAWGRIRVIRPAEGVTIFGDTLRSDLKTRYLHIRRQPYVVAETSDSIHHWGWTEYDEKTKRLIIRQGKQRNKTWIFSEETDK